jgi:AAA domain/Winged helix-turn-helix DNA-binding
VTRESAPKGAPADAAQSNHSEATPRDPRGAQYHYCTKCAAHLSVMGHLEDCITLIPQHVLDGPALGAYRKQQSPNGHDPAKTWSAVELLNAEFPEPRWAVPGIVAEGVNLLVGAPKLGKSWLDLNVGIAVANGGRAFGHVQVEQGPVLYLALEDTPRRLQSRLRMVLGDDPAPDGLEFWTRCESIPDGGAERIRTWLDDYRDARLVIIDVLTRMRGRVSDRSDRYQADYRAMTEFKTIADDYSVPFLVTHHTRKAAADDFLDTVSGSHGLAGAADAVSVLKRSRGASDATLSITGRDVEEAQYPLKFSPEIGTWALLEGPVTDYEVSKTRRQILGVVREQEEGITPKDIAGASGLSHDVVTQRVRNMVDEGQLDTDGSGRYFLPPRSPVTRVTGVTDTEPESDGSDEGDASLDLGAYTSDDYEDGI